MARRDSDVTSVKVPNARRASFVFVKPPAIDITVLTKNLIFPLSYSVKITPS